MFDSIVFEDETILHTAVDADRHFSQAENNAFSTLRHYYKEQQEDVNYRLEGHAKTLFPAFISSTAREQLLYLEVFGLLDAGENYFTKRKNYPSYLFLHTYAGAGELHYEGKTYALREGDSFLIDCTREQEYFTTSSHWSISNLHFNGPTADLFYQAFFSDGSPVVRHSSTSPYQNDVEQLLMISQGTAQDRDLHVSVALETLLLHLIEEKRKKQPCIPPQILQLQNYLESNFSRKISLDELEAELHISKYHLSREFKRYTGYSIGTYLCELRMNRAQYLLTNTALPTGLISQMVGFANYSNFYTTFRKQTGLSPLELRQSAGIVTK